MAEMNITVRPPSGPQRYQIIGKDGRKYEVIGGTREEAIAAVQARTANQNPKPVDTSMGTAFKDADLTAQISGREGSAALGRVVDNSFVGDALRWGQANIGNPVREFLGADPIDQDQIEKDFQEKALKQAQVLRAERDKFRKDTNFKSLTTDDINDLPSFVNFVTQKMAQSGPQMMAAIGSGGSVVYPMMVGELTEAQEKLDGLTQEQKDRTAALGGLVMTALENLGIAKLLPNGTSTSILGGVASGLFSEGITEFGQELVKIGVEYNAGKKFAEGEVLNRLKEAAAAGAAVGGPIKGSGNAATKVSKIFTSDGKVNQPGDLDTNSAKAAADFARRLRTIADANGYDLKDVGANSTKGSRETLDKAHIQMTEELKKVFRDLGDSVKPTDKETFQETTDKILAQAAYREARNKTKSTVGQQEINAIRRLVGETAEGQQALNLMLQLNQLTEVHNEGYKGGLSRFTDVFNPIDQNINSYDGASRIVTGTLAPVATLAAGVSTGGASIIPQAGAYGAGRVIDKLTGRRSRVDRYVRRNERNQGLPQPTGESVKAEERQNLADLEAWNTALAGEDAPPTPKSPQWTMEDASGLRSTDVSRILQVLKSDPEKPRIVKKAIQEYEDSVTKGGTVSNLNELIREVTNFQKKNPDFATRIRPPNSLSNPQPMSAPAQPGQAPNVDTQTYGPRYTTPENYNRGIQNNLDANRAALEGVIGDPDLNQAQKAQLATSLDVLATNLGADPVAAAEAQIVKLQEAGVPQDAIDAYVQPYVDRVIGQQASKAPRQSTSRLDEMEADVGQIEGSDLRISTRFPTQKASTEDPISGNLTVDTEAMKATPKAFEHNMDLVTEYVNFPTSKIKNRNPDQIAEDFKEEVVGNLLWLHDKVPSQIRDRSKLWYDGARSITTRWAEKYGVPDQGIAGVLAALSPQKDWYQNVSLAERVLDTMTGQVETLWSQKMSDTAADIFGKPKYAPALQEIQGKTLQEVMDLNNDALTAMWIRTFDEAHNDRRYRTVSSEGNFIGEPSGKTAWGSLPEIGKAVSVIRDPSYENVTVQMGARHKVRNFYNNIVSPNSPNGDVTIDTHAVAGGLLRPLSGNSTEVVHNFGTSLEKKKQPEGYRAAKASGIMGAQGLYGLYADAYREAAKRRGIKPREMQSITWEAVRGLFPAKWKQKKNVKAVEDIWKQYRNGDISITDARNAVEELAGGIDEPTWYEGPNSTTNAEVSDTSYAGQLDRPSVAGDARGMDGGDGRGDPRLSKRAPTGGLRGILSNAFQGADPGPSARRPAPSDGEIRQQYPLVRAPFEVGKPGTDLENGIKNIDQLNRLAEAYKVNLKAYRSQRKMLKELAPGFKMDPGTSGLYNPDMNAAGYLVPGTKRKDGGVVTPNESFVVAIHELAHAVADKQADGSVAPFNVRMFNSLTNEESTVSQNSFDYHVGLILGKSSKEMDAIKDEIINLQDKVHFTFAEGESIPTRDLAAFEARYKELAPVRGEKFRRKWAPLVRNHRNYVRNINEMAVDPLSWYLFDPKAFKKEAPKTAKMMREFFNEAGSIKFYNHPLAMGVAVILAMLMQADQDDEQKRMMPPGALNQPMPAGALSA